MARRATARAKTASDDVYNARKRFSRSALRNIDKAEKSSGATAAKYRRLAEEDLRQAIATYDTASKKPNYLREIREAASSLGVDIGGEIATLPSYTPKERRQRVERSFDTLEGRLQDTEVRRDRQARALLNNEEIGSRILGGLVDVWKKKATVWDEESKRYKVDNSKIEGILIDYFGVGSLADVLDKLEESIGSKLYDVTEERANIYETVKLLIQTKVIENTLVQ